jgi:hypothetical protein
MEHYGKDVFKVMYKKEDKDIKKLILKTVLLRQKK